MDFLIFSDSHGKPAAMQKALDRQIAPPHAVFFLGDGVRDLESVGFGRSALHAVRGNCDWLLGNYHFQTEQILNYASCRFLITHGHEYGVKSGYGALIARAVELDVDVVLFGHTHLPHSEMLSADLLSDANKRQRPLYLFNPGSIGMEGRFGTLTVQNGSLLFSHGRI